MIHLCITITLIVFGTANDETEDYPTDGNIELCETVDPLSEDDCKIHSDIDNACCFTELVNDEGSLNKCTPIPRRYRFSLDFVKSVIVNEQEYSPVFKCNHVSQTCGTDNPNKVFKCREHSSNTITCCYIKYTNNDTDCILADSKFKSEVNSTVNDMTIVCGSMFNKINILLLIFIWFLKLL